LIDVLFPDTRRRHTWGKGWEKKAPVDLCHKAVNLHRMEADEEVLLIFSNTYTHSLP
jgi:hypothetical protein